MVTRAMVSEAVDLIFERFKDFTQLVQFSNVSVSGFNFGSGTKTSTSVTVEIPLILTSSKLDADSRPLFEFVGKSKEIDFSIYNTFTYSGKQYKVESSEYFEGAVLLKARRNDA
jgi:hypothetical protein